MTTTKDCRVCDNCGQPIAWGLGRWWHATFLGCVIMNPTPRSDPMTATTWSTLADRLEAKKPDVVSETIHLTVLERDELVAFLRGLPMEFADPARAAADVSEQEVQDRVVALIAFANRDRAAAGIVRFCLSCNVDRPTYFAGDGGSVEAGTECCSGCGRVVNDDK